MLHSGVEFEIILYETAVQNPINRMNIAHSTKIPGSCQIAVIISVPWQALWHAALLKFR